MGNKHGFTLVELIVTIVVIGILAGISIVAYNQIQRDARDNTRKGTITLITDALDKYYRKNGEYPSVRSLVNNYAGNTGAAVATKLEIKASDLVMPKMPSNATNPLTTVAGTPTNDYIAYDGASTTGNTNCQTSLTGGRERFTLRYVNEAGTVISVASRYSGTPGS